MANGTPVGRLKINVNGTKYSVLTVWRGEQGGYSLSLDKDRQGYPAMGPIEAMKAWAAGAYLDYWPERPREQPEPTRAQGRQRASQGRAGRQTWESVGEHPPFDEDDIPFDFASI